MPGSPRHRARARDGGAIVVRRRARPHRQTAPHRKRLLAVIGGADGVLLAYWSGRALGTLLPADLPRVGTVGAGGRVLAFGVITSCAVGVLCGLAPALHLSRGWLATALRDGGRGSSTGVRGRRTMGALIIGALALALVLAVAAGLMLQSFWRLRHVDPGFHANGVLTLGVAPPASRYENDNALRTFYDQVLERVAALPGVRKVGAVHILPKGRRRRELRALLHLTGAVD